VNDRPIGVFDSGVGGLTVARELLRQLPEENLLYLGDTARVPYGPRGSATITRFALELVQFLLQREVKALVVACNSISASAIEAVRRLSPVPVIDVIEPTVRTAVAATRTGRIGVIGTVATVASGVYERHAAALDRELEVVPQACPLFVPIAEEGLADHPVARLMAEEYAARFREEGVDVLILGCTHYPLLKPVLAQVLGPEVELIDSAGPTIADLATLLRRRGLERSGAARHRFCVTDASYKFLQIANAMLGADVSDLVEQVCVELPPGEGLAACILPELTLAAV
jgi:glutamate racemase